MQYKNIEKGIFVSRPNRFTAIVEIDGTKHTVHVKNTGRCRELLISGVSVFLEKSDNENRKTQYDLIAVLKGKRIVNIDSQAPNKIFHEWLLKSGYFGKNAFIKPETKYKNSRFDFYVESEKRKIFVEVKGVTLEENNIVAFPDAPTERGVKHINELCESVKEGYEAYIFFIVQIKGVDLFVPNRRTHKAFADALFNASKNKVNVMCLDCDVSENEITANDFVKINLTEGSGYFE